MEKQKSLSTPPKTATVMLNAQRRREITMESMQRKKIGNNGLKKR
jgi:hypothetical protein